jgi:hypothetical protein
MRRCLLLSLATATAGCGQILGIDDPTSAVIIDAALDAAPDFTCSTGPLVDTAAIDTTAAGDGFTLSCSDTGSTDVALTFSAPATDYYLFSTAGSSFDTALALYDQCGGTELACNQNLSASSSQSELVRKIERGRDVLVVVDGFAGSRGAATVTASAVTCPNQDLEGRTFPLALNIAGTGNDIAAACAASPGTTPVPTPGEDAAFHWVAPSAGLWAFRASAQFFQPVIAVHRGPRCVDKQLGCNTGYNAEVVRNLAAGEQVSVVVDSDSATQANPGYDLTIEARTGTCPEAELAAGFQPATVTATFSERTLAPSCGYTQLIDRGGGLHEMGDITYSLMTPINPNSRAVSCSVTGTSTQPFVLYALEGTVCGGAETDCNASRPDATTGNEATIFLSGKPDASIPYTVVVAGGSITPAPVELTTQCNIAI